MARLARVVLPNLPHHVTQRGNRRETVFFSEKDYAAYIDLLRERLQVTGTLCWAYCLMPNHVHLILEPQTEEGLRNAVAPVHKAYARRVNMRNQWTGHLWQGRFGSVVMDEEHAYQAMLYVMLNPVRAKLVKRLHDWKWSSFHAMRSGEDDGLVSVEHVLKKIGDFDTFMKTSLNDEMFDRLRKAEIVGRPVGDEAFMDDLEARLDRKLKPSKPGPSGKGTES